MAVEMPIWTKGFKAGGTIRQFRFVKQSADQTVIECAGATDIPIGVAQDAATSGLEVSVMIIGETKLDADAAIAVGDGVGTSADGQAAVYVAGTGTTNYIVGRCTKAVSNAGEIASAVINCATPARGA